MANFGCGRNAGIGGVGWSGDHAALDEPEVLFKAIPRSRFFRQPAVKKN